MTEPSESENGPEQLGERVRWLFDVVVARTDESPGGSPDSRPRWRPYTIEEVAAAVGPPLGIRDLTAAVASVERLRAGVGVLGQELEVLAEFFGAPAEYFGEDRQLVVAAQEQLLARAMRECQVQTYRLCRIPVVTGLRRRELLRRALELVRRTSPGPSLELSGDRSNKSIEFSKAPSPVDAACQDRAGVGASERSAPTVRMEGAVPNSQTWLGSLHLPVQRPMSVAALRDLCGQLLRELDIPPPLSPEQLCQRLGAARGRRIKLVGDELYTTASVGHLISKARTDLIAYQATAPRLHQAHVIYHEVMHIVCGHLDGADALTCGALEADLDELIPADDSSAGLYDRWQEWEAETGATILSELAGQRARPRALGKDVGRSDRAIAAAFGLSRIGWP
jgi:hypothetical protein